MTHFRPAGERRQASSRFKRRTGPRHRRLIGERLEPRTLLAGDISGRVWHDTNANGLLDAGEPGAAGALVEIVRTVNSEVGDTDDQVLAKVDTDPAGNYTYTTPGAGSYYLRFLPPTGGGVGYRFTLANVGTDDTIDSDVIPVEGRSEVLQQAAGASLVVGAGLIEESSHLGLAFTIGGPGTQHGKAVATDAAGNVYVGGWFGGPSLDLDPGPGVASVTSRGGSDGFVAKYDASGRLIWGQSFGSVAADMVRSMAVDGQGNVYLAGEINQTAYFGSGAGALTLLDVPGSAGFIVKLDPAGNVLWGHRTPTGGTASDLALDESGAVYVTGAHFGDGGSLNFRLFAWKLNPQGTTEWMVQTDGGSVSSTESIAVGGGKVYVTGTLSETIDFDPSGDVLNLTSVGNQDFFLWQLNAATGTLDSAFQIGGPNYDRGYGVAVSGDGSVYVTGHFWGTVDFDPTAGVTELSFPNLTGFVAKYDNSGKLAWVRTPSNGGGAGHEIVVDALGNSWSVGSFVGSVDLDPSPNAERLFTTKGNADVYLWGLNADGQLIDAFSAGGLTWDYPDDIAISPSGNRILAAGKMEKSVDFDPGAGLYSLTALPTATDSEFGPSSQDAFLWAIGPAEIVVPPLVSRSDNYTTREDNPVTIAAPGVLTNDGIGGELLTAEIGERPAHGTVELRADGSFTFVPANNYHGQDRFTYRAKRGETLSGLATVSLTITAVNDAPTGEDKTIVVREDSAILIQASDYGFRDSQDEPGNLLKSIRIASLPTVGLLAFEDVQVGTTLPTGSTLLRFTPPADANGNSLASFTFQLQDDGGTANGGVDLDPLPNTITFNVISVNDPPSFVPGADQDAHDESGAVNIDGWATEISAGPSDEANQTLSFAVIASNPSLFNEQPAIDASGTLSYTPAPAMNAEGTVVVSVVLSDDGGTENEGRNTSETRTFEIRIVKLHPMHNAEEPLDVGGDGGIAANDALDCINFLNAFGTGGIPDDAEPGWGFLDVNADGFITAADPLQVINYLNAFGATPPPPEDDGDGDGEGEGAQAADDFSTLIGLLAFDAAENATRHRQRG